MGEFCRWGTLGIVVREIRYKEVNCELRQEDKVPQEESSKQQNPWQKKTLGMLKLQKESLCEGIAGRVVRAIQDTWEKEYSEVPCWNFVFYSADMRSHQRDLSWKPVCFKFC